MSDYIKREDAIDAIGEAVADGLPKGWYLPLTMIPSADVEPVRHGRWIERCEDQDGIYEFCSECGIDTDITHYGESYAYCPNCGAHMMDGDAE